MSCSKFETDIALYAGGDLPAGRIARVESHLAECADCRALAADLRASQSLLAELRDEPLEDAMLLQVRQRVLAEVNTTPWRAGFSRRGTLVSLLALAAALLLAVVLAWPRHAVKPAPVARVELPHAMPAPRPNIVPAHHRAVRHRRPAPAAQPGPPLLVQFVTDNPNIVIYWLVDQKPQGD
jgi:anti-sigma factor RsiW